MYTKLKNCAKGIAKIPDKNVFWTRLYKHNSKKVNLKEPEIDPGTSRTPVLCATSGPPRQLDVSIEA